MRVIPQSTLLLASLAVACTLLPGGNAQAQSADARFESRLIWATNDKKSPDPNHKAVEPEIREKLAKLHLKWENFFEVNKVAFTVAKGGTNCAVMSPKCALEVKLLDANRVEVSLLGKKGDRPCRQIQPLPKGEILVFGGNAPDATAWLVALKRIE